MSLLSQGPFGYNRFQKLEEQREAEKRYYTQKLQEKKAKPDFLDMDGDGDKKEPMKKAIKEKGKKPVNEKRELPDFIKKKMDEKKGKDKDCKCEEWVEEMVQGGYDLSEFTYAELEDAFYESAIQYPTGKKNSFTKDKSDPKVKAGREAAKKMGLKMNEGTIEEAIINYLIENGFANNPVSAEVVFSHMSEDWRNSVANQIEEGYKAKKKKA